MIKVLIAETEQSVIEDITNIFQEEVKEAKVIAHAFTGREAVQMTLELKPELVLIDIKIKGLNGLEAVRKIREIDQQVHIIIISAYDYFEFARVAMVLKVSDYILKPYNKATLLKSIRTENALILGERKRISCEYQETKIYNLAMEYVEYSFIYSMLFNHNFDNDVEHYKEVFGIIDLGYIINIEMAPTLVWDASQVEKIKRYYNKKIKKVISEYADSIIGPTIGNRIVVYVFFRENEPGHVNGFIKDIKEKRQEAIVMAYHIVDLMKNDYQIDVNVGIGSVRSIKSIHSSYEESLKCLKYERVQNVVHIKELKMKQISSFDYSEIESKLLENVKYGKQEAVDIFTEILELIRPYHNTERKNKIFELLLLSCYASRSNKGKELECFECDRILDELSSLSDEVQEVWAIKKFESILRSVKNGNIGKKSIAINLAMEYIQRHYNEDLTLNEVSKYVNISPQHFSKIFKDETQQNFVEWIAKLRIDKAKEYMNTSDMTIKEICYIVGYQDPNYFSRIFKKYVGVSPTEYQKGIIS